MIVCVSFLIYPLLRGIRVSERRDRLSNRWNQKHIARGTTEYWAKRLSGLWTTEQSTVIMKSIYRPSFSRPPSSSSVSPTPWMSHGIRARHANSIPYNPSVRYTLSTQPNLIAVGRLCRRALNASPHLLLLPLSHLMRVTTKPQHSAHTHKHTRNR